MSDTTFIFGPVPHTEAAQFIKDKPVVVRSVFNKLLPELQGRAFTITGVEMANVLQTVRDHIADLPLGADWNTIKHDIANDISPFIDDVTMSPAENKAAAEARAELLLRVHGFQAYSAMNERVIQAQKDVFPFAEYVTVGDDRVRPAHQALDGKIVPVDSPFWDTHTPPWDWGCRCQKVPRTAADVGKIKQKQASLPPEKHSVIEGARLKKLEQGHLITPDGKMANVAPQTGPGAYISTPGELRLPIEQLKKQYDGPVWDQFEGWAKKQELSKGVSVMDWLKGAEVGLVIATPAEALATALVHHEAQIRLQPKETGIALDATGQTIFEKTGSSKEIQFTDQEWEQLENATFTHNHPQGTSFSMEDVRAWIVTNMAEMRVAGKQYRYSLKRPADGWPQPKLIDRWLYFQQDVKPVYNQIKKDVLAELDAKISLGQLSAPEAKAQVAHLTLTRLSEQFGWDYQQETWK